MSRFFAVIMLVVMLGSAAPVQAQTDAVEPTSEPEETESLLECFDFYSSNNIEVSLATTDTSVAPNDTVTFNGTVSNLHTYPLVDVQLHAKVFKRNVQSATSQGDILVEQVVASEKLVISAQSNAPVTYKWQVPANAEGGLYYAVFFVTAAGSDFPVMGYTVADDAIPNQIDFTVVHDGYVPVVGFDTSTLTVNGQPYQLQNQPTIGIEEDTTISVTVVNPTDMVKVIPIQWNISTFKTAADDQLIASQTELLTLQPNEKRALSYTIESNNDGWVQATAVIQDEAVKQFLNVTAVRKDSQEPAVEIPLASISSFPLKAGEPVTLFACLSKLSNAAPQAAIDAVVTITNLSGELVHQYVYSGPISTQDYLVGETFTPTEDYRQLVLTADVQYEGAPLLQSTITYDCDDERFGGCVTIENAVTTNVFPKSFALIQLGFILLGVLLLIIILFVFMKKRKVGPPTPTMTIPRDTMLKSVIIMIGIGIAVTAVPFSANAQSCGALQFGYTSATLSFGLVSGFHPSDVTLYNGGVAPNCQALCTSAMASLSGVRYCNYHTSVVGMQFGFVVPDVGLSNGSTVYHCRLSQQPLALVGTSWPYTSNWSGSSCTPPPPPASGSISGSGCTISSGASNCNGSLTWSTSNALAANVHNTTTNTNFSNSTNGTAAVLLNQGTSIFAVRNGTTNLNTVSLTASCVSGTSWNGSVCAPPPPQAAVGSFDAADASNCTVAGWTFDPDSSNTSIDIHVYRDGPAGSGSFVTSCRANGSRPDVNAAFGISGNHGFNCFLPASYATLGNRNLYIHAIDVNGTPNNVIGNSPRALNCTPPPPPPAAATISGTGCTVPAGGDNCTGSLTWNITNATSPNVRNTTVGMNYSTNPTGSGAAVVLQQGTNTVVARDNTTALASVNLSATCTAGTSWNGATCALPVVPDVNLRVNGSDGPVTVTVGQSLNLTWTGTAVSNCTVWGANWGSGRAVAITGNETVSATVSGNYIINCTGDSDTVVVNVLPVPTATLEMNVNGGAWTGANQTVNPTDTVRLRWSSTNATSCTGTNFNTSGAANNATGVVATLPAPGSSQTYSLSCTGAGGTNGDTITVTNRQLPNLSTPIINLTPSGTYDTVTGTYDSVIVDFGTSNNGGSPTGAVVPYRFEFDRGNNGYEENATGQFAALNNGASANTSRSAANVPFGSATVRITVDHTNSITESNESDNVSTRTITLSPPAPNLELAVSPSFIVRTGDVATLTWDVNATYPMTCTVAGPAFTTVTFDPSVDGPTGSAQTGPISTQSNYTLTCTEPTTSTTFPPAEIVVETVGSVEEI